MVGAFMMVGARKVEWTELHKAIPAFLTMIMMPLTTSITEGIAFGFIATSILFVASGRGREVHWGTHVIATLFLFRYIWI